MTTTRRWHPRGFVLAAAVGAMCLSQPAAAAEPTAEAAGPATPSISDAGVAGLLSDVTQTLAPPPAAAPEAPPLVTLDTALRLRVSLPRKLSNLQAGEDAARRAIFHRERLGARFVQGPIDAHVQLQASGACGDVDPGTSVLPTVGLQQGVVRLRPQATPWITADVGRMILNFGSGRMIGDYDFHAVGNAFDGIRAQLRYQKYLEADLLAVKLRHNSAVADQDRNLFGAYITGRPHQHLVAELYFLYLVDGTAAGDSRLLTMGSRLDWQPTTWLRAEAEGALQVGADAKQATKDDTSHIATAAFVQLDFAWTGGRSRWTLSPFAQAYSGEPTQTGKAATSTAWRPLYPSIDKVVGLLQLFRPTNLMQEGLRLDVEPLPQLVLSVDLRASLSRDNAPLPGFNGQSLPGNGTWRWLGTEVDLMAKWQVVRSSDVLLGVGIFAPSGRVEAIVGHAVASQGLLQWTTRF